MKNVLMALALLAGSAMVVSTAQAQVPVTPLWACTFHAHHTPSKSEAPFNTGASTILFNVSQIQATGMAKCVALGVGKVKFPVTVTIEKVSVGLELIAATEGKPFDITLKAGLATPAALIGTYSITGGISVAPIIARIGVNAGIESTPGQSIALKVTVDGQPALGIGAAANLSGSMTVSSAQ